MKRPYAKKDKKIVKKKKQKQQQSQSKPIMRRIGFDFPDALINEFKAATSISKTTMTAKISAYMREYCDLIKKEEGLERLTK